eukprot:CAMPEP_0204201808 /NCGR_PEP_ID=MMETSP0361-20130328/67752_1 /ASSEMBLY_ACC=CAM_ASM_000343 /TAXON_ID=268821 /ORGANISM="Scrippsiella Hangoei, Strain SHTV-5" /LENGTH=72 /DNA_ID=CAMNT_0051164505 /DNA_START=69 /DNA_END=284 /DNA_ORIENTATION=+
MRHHCGIPLVAALVAVLPAAWRVCVSAGCGVAWLAERPRADRQRQVRLAPVSERDEEQHCGQGGDEEGQGEQ